MENISNKLKIAIIITILIPIIILLLFLIGLSKVEAQTYSLSPNNLTPIGYYGTQTYNLTSKNCNNNVCFWNANANSTSIRWNSQTNLTYNDIKIIVFNMEIYSTNTSQEWPLNDVSFGDYSCYYIRSNNNILVPNEQQATIGISAFCPVNGNITLSNGSKTANVTFDNSGGFNVSKVSLSNISLSSNVDLSNIISSIASLNTTLINMGYKIDTTNQDLTYILQSTNNSAYWNEVNSGKLQNIYDMLSTQTTTIVQAQNNTTNAINDMANEDIDNNTKQPVDNTNVNDYNTKEANLMNTATQTNLNDVSIGIDSTASGNIWQLITRVLNTNAKVFGLVISILSIGIIKLMLAR